mmetsp:Transcript_35863/g.55011  ORF Transcript_35863/g.55011 Transcript_35863/m.55011 type:complete len:137 (-) Transcript_35863:16-426(-)
MGMIKFFRLISSLRDDNLGRELDWERRQEVEDFITDRVKRFKPDISDRIRAKEKEYNQLIEKGLDFKIKSSGELNKEFKDKISKPGYPPQYTERKKQYRELLMQSRKKEQETPVKFNNWRDRYRYQHCSTQASIYS